MTENAFCPVTRREWLWRVTGHGRRETTLRLTARREGWEGAARVSHLAGPNPQTVRLGAGIVSGSGLIGADPLY